MWPFKRREVPEFYEERRPRKKVTSNQIADEIIVKAMKADPMGYGLDVAERLKGIRKDKGTGGLGEFKEIAETFGINLKDLGKPGKGGGIGGALLDAVNSVPQALKEWKETQAQAWQIQKEQMMLSGKAGVEQIQEPQKPQLPPVTPQPVQPPPLVLSLSDLIRLSEVVDMTPEEAVQTLDDDKKGKKILKFVKANSYEKLNAMLKPYVEDSQYGAFVTQVLEQKADWFKEVVDIVHKSP